jgi:hypothetical protein
MPTDLQIWRNFFFLAIFALGISCEAPKDISGKYAADMGDSVYMLYDFGSNNRFECKLVYQGEYFDSDSGKYFLRTDSLFMFSDKDSVSTDCPGIRITKRSGDKLIFHFDNSSLPCSGLPTYEEWVPEKVVVKKLKPKD